MAGSHGEDDTRPARSLWGPPVLGRCCLSWDSGQSGGWHSWPEAQHLSFSDLIPRTPKLGGGGTTQHSTEACLGLQVAWAQVAWGWPLALSCWKNFTEGSSFTWELLGSASPPVFSSLGTPASADKQVCWWLQGRTLVMWSLVCGQEAEHRCVDPRSADEELTVRPQAAALMMFLSKRTKPQMVYRLGHRGSAMRGKCPTSSLSWREGKNAVGLAERPSGRRGYGES